MRIKMPRSIFLCHAVKNEKLISACLPRGTFSQAYLIKNENHVRANLIPKNPELEYDCMQLLHIVNEVRETLLYLKWYG